MNDLQPQRRHRPTKAMILAAGEGRRLRPFTDALPKCMIPVAGKPVLEHAIEHLCHYGVSEVIINVCFLAGVIREYFGDGHRWGVQITYSEEPHLFGTAGGVKRVRWFFDCPSYVWYGDNLSTCNLARLYQVHRARGGLATIALFHREDPSASGVAELGADDRIMTFQEKPLRHQARSRWINAGIYVMEPELVDAIPDGDAPDFGRDVFPALLASGAPLYGYRMSEPERLWWIDTPQDLDRVRAHLHLEEAPR